MPILVAGRLVASRQQRIAEIRAREAEMSRLSWRLEFALAASDVGVWDVDLANDQLHLGRAGAPLFGFPEREGFFSEADWIGSVHPDDRARALAEARAAATGRGKFVSLYRIVRPDGEIRHVRDVAGLYTDSDGSRRLVGLVWDVTARRRARGRARPAPPRGRGGDRGEVAFPRRDEPRDPHADDRRARAARADARRAAAAAPARAGDDRARLGREPARDPERHPRLLEARGRADPHRPTNASRSAPLVARA